MFSNKAKSFIGIKQCRATHAHNMNTFVNIKVQLYLSATSRCNSCYTIFKLLLLQREVKHLLHNCFSYIFDATPPASNQQEIILEGKFKTQKGYLKCLSFQILCITPVSPRVSHSPSSCTLQQANQHKSRITLLKKLHLLHLISYKNIVQKVTAT